MEEEIGYKFYDSPHQIPLQELLNHTSLSGTEDTHRTLPENSTKVWLISFKKPGHGTGLKEVSMYLSDAGLRAGPDVGKFLVELYNERKTVEAVIRERKAFDVESAKVIAATDVLESLLLRMNHLLRGNDLWIALQNSKVEQGPFRGGREAISYASLCIAHPNLVEKDPWTPWIRYWIIFAMDYAEKEYLSEFSDKYVSTDELRDEIWDYLIVSKRLSNRNVLAHPFCNSLQQLSSTNGQVRWLTSKPASLTEETRESLILQLEELGAHPPSMFQRQAKCYALQVSYLKSKLSVSSQPSPLQLPPRNLRTIAMPIRPLGTDEGWGTVCKRVKAKHMELL